MIAQAQAELPNECCGMLAGRLSADGLCGEVSQGYPLVNEAHSPMEYVSEGRSMLRAEKARREAGLEFLAVYHSHPASGPIPSRTDLKRNYCESVMNFIISLQEDLPKMEGWWLTDTDFRPAEWQITDEG